MKIIFSLRPGLPVCFLTILLSSPLLAQKYPLEPLTTFDYDFDRPLEISEKSSIDEATYTRVDITYASPGGGSVPAYLYEPEGEGPFAGLILLHGMPGSRENATRFAERFVETGAVVLAITAPFARPDDTPRERPITFTLQDREEQIQLIQDLRRGVDLLIDHPKVDVERIGFSGGSYGAAMGGLLAGVETRIKAYSLWVGDGGLVAHTTGPDDLRGPFFRLSAEQQETWLRAMEPIEPIRFVGSAAPAALFFQAGRNDRAVPAADAEQFMAAGSEPKTIQWYDTGHGLNSAAFRDQAEWLGRMIGIDAAKWK